MEERKKYIDKLSAQLKTWDVELKKLEKKADTVKAEYKVKYEQTMNDLRTKRTDLNSKLNEIKNSGGEAWHTFRDGAEKSWKELKAAFDKAISKF